MGEQTIYFSRRLIFGIVSKIVLCEPHHLTMSLPFIFTTHMSIGFGKILIKVPRVILPLGNIFFPKKQAPQVMLSSADCSPAFAE